MAIITIEDILKRKKYMDNKKDEVIEIEVEDFGIMKFKNCDLSTYFDVLESSNKDKDAEMLYYCSVEPNFRDESIINSLGCKSNPLEVANKFLNRLEVTQIASLIIEKSGLNKGSKIIAKN
ncbi:MAG: hypothetical protein ACRC6B_10010 [Fusobacteriaceae bacterium]